MQSAISSLHLDNGEYTKTENETLKELLQVQFPGSKIIIETSGGWDGLGTGISEVECVQGRLGSFQKGHKF
jgi:hypothetical protein